MAVGPLSERQRERGRRKRKPARPKSAGKPSYGPMGAKPPARRRPPAPDPLAGIFAPLEQWVAAQIAQEKARASGEAAKQQALMQGYGKWYAEKMPAQIQHLYGNAANQTAGFAKGFSDGMKIAQEQAAGEANKLIANAGGPEGQMIRPTSAGADVLYGMGGFIPASTLSQQGAAFGSAAAIQAGAIGAQGGVNARKILEDSGKVVGDLLGRQAEIKSKKAEARLRIREAKAKAKADAIKDAQELRYKWATLDLRAKEAILRNKREARRIYISEKRLGLAARSQSFNEWYKQKQVELSVARLDQGQQRIDAGAKKKTKWTPLQRQRFSSAANVWAKFVAEGGVDEDGNVLPPPSFVQALRDLPLEDFPAEFGIKALIKRFPKAKKIILDTARGLGLIPKANAAPSGGRKNASLPLSTKLPGGSEFGMADPEGAPSARGGRYHAAKDWFAPANSPVFAPEGGRVVEVKMSRGNSGQIYGGVVKVQTADGRVWVFRHVDPRGVRKGQRVKPGAIIASVSPWTGGSPHAHIELWRTREGGYVFENMMDPMDWFRSFV